MSAMPMQAAVRRVLSPPLVALCLAANSAGAATYYVDADKGNNLWQGTASAPLGVPATNGPWRSLKRVEQANLLPGDLVRFKCGTRWRETLRIARSGTSAAPIRFDAYGSGCSSAPAFDGANPVVTGWTPHVVGSTRFWKANVDFDVTQVLVNGVFVKPAQHPNAAFLSVDSVRSDAQANTIGFVDADARIAGRDLAGAGVHVRSNDYNYEYRSVNFNAATRAFTFAFATRYPLKEGYGYYLVNKLWMLDAPGEWFFQKTKASGGILYVWPSNGQSPASSLGAATNVVYATALGRDGIVARNQKYLAFSGLRVVNQNIGIDLSGPLSAGHTLSGITVESSALLGVKLDESVNVKLDRSSINNSVYQGVMGNYSTGLWIANSNVVNSGTVGSPRGSFNADGDYQLYGIFCFRCKQLRVSDNTIRNSGYIGIGAFAEVPKASELTGANPPNIVSGNYVKNACAVLDDCGAIYVIGRNGFNRPGFKDKTQIVNNIVVDSLGNANARPAGNRSSAQGIYLDDYSNGPVVTGNTVVNADNGLQLHLAANVEARGNTLFGNRRNAIWMQEDESSDNTAACGVNCIKNNVVRENLIYPKVAGACIAQDSGYASTSDFAVFDSNRYSSLHAATLLREEHRVANLPVEHTYTLEQWRAASGQDAHSSSFKAFGLGPWLVSTFGSTNFVSNADFNAGMGDWSLFPDSAQFFTPVGVCVSGGCMGFRAAAGAGSVAISNAFAVRAGQRYLVRFQARAAANTSTTVFLRRNGPTNYDSLTAPENVDFALTTRWQSFHVILTATKSVALSASGGRLDFEVPPRATIYLDNVLVSEVTARANDTNAEAKIFINTGAVPLHVACPNAQVPAAQCGSYVHFWDGAAHATRVVWPVSVAPKGSHIVVWNANPHRDADFDGVADSNDLCAGTPTSEPVNERGCAFAQAH